MPIIPTSKRLRQEDGKLEPNLDCVRRILSQKTSTNTKATTTTGMELHTSTREAVAGLYENEASLVYGVRPYGSINTVRD